MERAEFESLVQKALEELPQDFKDRLENVDVVIEDMPDMDVARKLRLGSRGRVLGLYQGIPLMARSHYYGMVLPDKITLYQANIERACHSGGEGRGLYEEIAHVLQHEIAHHFGISDQRLWDIGTY